ncbi:hypothetical protein U1Q18_051869, partial [Sarracenia purpurea var. burkii]
MAKKGEKVVSPSCLFLLVDRPATPRRFGTDVLENFAPFFSAALLLRKGVKFWQPMYQDGRRGERLNGAAFDLGVFVYIR